MLAVNSDDVDFQSVSRSRVSGVTERCRVVATAHRQSEPFVESQSNQLDMPPPERRMVETFQ